MRDSIGRTNRERAIQHTGQERDPTAPAGLIVPITPYKGVARVLFWHRRNHDDGYQPANDDQNQSSLLQSRDKPVAEDDKSTAHPRNDQVGDVDHPRLDDEVWMENSIHLHGDVGENLVDRG